MDWITIATVITGGGLSTFLTVILTLKYVRRKESGLAEQEIGKGEKEKATANQEIQKAYRDMVIDNENFRKNLMAEFEKVKQELQLYKNQCHKCANNKLG